MIDGRRRWELEKWEMRCLCLLSSNSMPCCQLLSVVSNLRSCSHTKKSTNLVCLRCAYVICLLWVLSLDCDTQCTKNIQACLMHFWAVSEIYFIAGLCHLELKSLKRHDVSLFCYYTSLDTSSIWKCSIFVRYAAIVSNHDVVRFKMNIVLMIGGGHSR